MTSSNELHDAIQRAREADATRQSWGAESLLSSLLKAQGPKEPKSDIRYEACTVVTVKYVNRLESETFLVRDLLISNDEFDPDQITQHAVAHMNTRINKAYDKGNLQLIILDEDYKFVKVVVIPTENIDLIEMTPGPTSKVGADGQRHSDTEANAQDHVKNALRKISEAFGVPPENIKIIDVDAETKHNPNSFDPGPFGTSPFGLGLDEAKPFA